MSHSRHDPERLLWLQAVLEDYIRVQRHRYAPQARMLTFEERSNFTNYIGDIDLERTRMYQADNEQIEKPAFYEQLRTLGLSGLPAFSLMEAVTFGDVIVSRAPLEPAVLFHELVHAIQYRLLGTRRFARLYARGLFTSGSYDLIPLESCTYQLAECYVSHGAPFDVEAEVQLQIAGGTL